MKRRERASVTSGITPRAPFLIVERNPQLVAAASLAILVGLAMCVALWAAKDFLLPIAVALVFSVLLAPLCGLIERLWIPGPLAAFLALATAGVIVWLAFSAIAQPASRWIDDAPQLIKRATRHIQELQAPLKPLTDISNQVEDLNFGQLATPPSRTVVMQEPGLAQLLMASAQTAIAQTGLVFILSLFLLNTRDEFRLKFLAFQPTLPRRVRAARVFRDVSRRVTGYIMTFATINFFVGVATGLAC